MTRQLCATFIALAALAITAPVGAQASIAGGLRLHLETDVLTIDSTKVEDADSETTTVIGPGVSGLGFGLGYAISEQLVLGGNLVLQSRNGEGDNDGVLALGLIPYIEFLFGEGSLRPFVGGALMLMTESGDNRSQTEFGLAGLGGLHIFLSDSFSLDVSGRLYFVSGSRSRDAGPMDVDTDYTRLGLLVLLGVSGWGI